MLVVNLGKDVGYSVSGASWFYSAPPDKFEHITTLFLPYPLQFIAN